MALVLDGQIVATSKALSILLYPALAMRMSKLSAFARCSFLVLNTACVLGSVQLSSYLIDKDKTHRLLDVPTYTLVIKQYVARTREDRPSRLHDRSVVNNRWSTSNV